MIRALFKFAKIPDLVEGKKPVIIDTTSSSGDFAELSPFMLKISMPFGKVIFENLWQYSKVYKKFIMPIDGYPDASYYKWRDAGFSNPRAVRYPMGKGALPEYSLWDGKKLGYIQARKEIYSTIYAKEIAKTGAFYRLEGLYSNCLNTNRELILLDYDAYDHLKLGMSLQDVINNPKRKMGHAFVLIMLLTDMLKECINS